MIECANVSVFGCFLKIKQRNVFDLRLLFFDASSIGVQKCVVASSSKLLCDLKGIQCVGISYD